MKRILFVLIAFFVSNFLIAQEMKSFFDFEALSIDGENVKFSEFKGKKILVVNTASKCGLTPQYKELEELGVGTHFQDPETKAVFEIVEPGGTFVSYKKVTYNRTKIREEKKGTLSKKRAQELGYDV